MGHKEAKQRDARSVLAPGEERTVVITEADVDSRGTGLTKIENIKTFVRQGEVEFGFADTVLVKIVDIGDSHAEALAISLEN